MIVEFWGTRSLIPLAASLPRQFGGNTACVCIRETDDITVVFDCGTGAAALGGSHELSSVSQAHFFISKYSWDRTQGLPFTAPLYRENFSANFYALTADDGDLEDLLTAQMRYEFFPVQFRSLPCRRRFHHLTCADEQHKSVPVSPWPYGTMTAIKLHPRCPESAFKWLYRDTALAYAVHIDWEHPYPSSEYLLKELGNLQLLITNLPESERAWQNFWQYQLLAQPQLTVFSDFSPYLEDQFISSVLKQAQTKLTEINGSSQIQAACDGLRINI